MQLATKLSLFFSFHFLHSKCHQPSLPNRHVTLKKASDSQTLIFFSSTLGMYEILSGPVSLKTMLFSSPWPPWKVPRPVCATSRFSVCKIGLLPHRTSSPQGQYLFPTLQSSALWLLKVFVNPWLKLHPKLQSDRGSAVSLGARQFSTPKNQCQKLLLLIWPQN